MILLLNQLLESIALYLPTQQGIQKVDLQWMILNLQQEMNPSSHHGKADVHSLASHILYMLSGMFHIKSHAAPGISVCFDLKQALLTAYYFKDDSYYIVHSVTLMLVS